MRYFSAKLLNSEVIKIQVPMTLPHSLLERSQLVLGEEGKTIILIYYQMFPKHLVAMVGVHLVADLRG